MNSQKDGLEDATVNQQRCACVSAVCKFLCPMMQEAKRLEAQRVAVENERMTAELATASQDKTELQAQVVQQQQEIARLKMYASWLARQQHAVRIETSHQSQHHSALLTTANDLLFTCRPAICSHVTR